MSVDDDDAPAHLQQAVVLRPTVVVEKQGRPLAINPGRLTCLSAPPILFSTLYRLQIFQCLALILSLPPCRPPPQTSSRAPRRLPPIPPQPASSCISSSKNCSSNWKSIACSRVSSSSKFFFNISASKRFRYYYQLN